MFPRFQCTTQDFFPLLDLVVQTALDSVLTPRYDVTRGTCTAFIFGQQKRKGCSVWYITNCIETRNFEVKQYYWNWAERGKTNKAPDGIFKKELEARHLKFFSNFKLFRWESPWLFSDSIQWRHFLFPIPKTKPKSDSSERKIVPSCFWDRFSNRTTDYTVLLQFTEQFYKNSHPKKTSIVPVFYGISRVRQDWS